MMRVGVQRLDALIRMKPSVTPPGVVSSTVASEIASR
jgi:hypothetical protein